MAQKAPGPPATTPADPVEEKLHKKMCQLVQRAVIDRARHQARIADCYKFTMPWRHKFYQTTATVDLDEIFDSTAMTVLEDFAADMLNTFTPQKNDWLSEAPVETMNAGDANIISKPLAARQRVVFSEMARSNLYQAMQSNYLDLGISTMCLLVTDIDAAKPLHCEAIPQTDLLLARGPYGTVSPFRRKTYLREEVAVLWPDADLSKCDQGHWTEAAAGAEQEWEVTDGCWRDWEEKGSEKYHYVVECRGKIIYRKEYTGPGSCPFIVAAWSKDSTTAWGVGPTYRELPTIKTLNHVRFLDLKNYDKFGDPVTSYEDDGVTNIDGGIEPGTWIPRAPGSKPPEVIESKGNFDAKVFERDELRSSLRRAHYQDRPEQLGKTPPSATQWADEAAERARRMGTPATNLVQDWQIPIYQRYVYLLTQRGTLKKIQVNGKDIALQPISPLLRAQEQEVVVRNDRFAELIVSRFGPQVAMIVIDIVAYANQQADKLGIDKSLVRDQAAIADAIQQLMPILKATGSVPAAAPTVVPAGLVGPQGGQ